MASNWKGIVHVRANEDRLPLWQRRTNKRSAFAESGSESGRGTTSSGASRSSSIEDDRLDERLAPPRSRVIQQLSPVFNNRFNDRFDERPVARSNSFRENDPASLQYTPVMGGYRRDGSPHPPSINRTDRLTADYVPSWRPDRRFSTPAVPRYIGRLSRSPSPRFLSKKGQQQFEYFRSRAASLPASSGSIPTKRRLPKPPQGSDYWPQTRSPSRVEQRFLKLSESADYDKVRTFVLGAKGELVEHGFCYRHKSETGSSSSPASTGPATSPNEDRFPVSVAAPTESPTADQGSAESSPTRAVPKYSVLVIGSPAVGKSSLLSSLKQSQGSSDEDTVVAASVDNESGLAITIPILICGEEIHLEFYEYSVKEIDSWSSVQWQAVIVVYSISDKRSFSAAADALYQIRNEARGRKNGKGSSQKIPILLVANKVDLERQRQVQDQEGIELSKSYDCRFLDVSVQLSHHVENLLSSVMNEMWRCTVTAFRQRQSQVDDDDLSHLDEGQKVEKSRRFSLRKSKQKSKDFGKPRSSRARSLFTLPDGLPAALSESASHRVSNGGGFLSRFFGRRTAKSCEDLFSRLLRG